jgi:hypothetical protein
VHSVAVPGTDRRGTRALTTRNKTLAAGWLEAFAIKQRRDDLDVYLAALSQAIAWLLGHSPGDVDARRSLATDVSKRKKRLGPPLQVSDDRDHPTASARRASASRDT